MECELSDIIKDHIDDLELTYHKQKVLNNLRYCRTAEAGTHLLECNNKKCCHEEYSYNSCRDRHCPKCSGSKQIRWVKGRNQELLPVNYSHIVFKVPRYLDLLFKIIQSECYDILFKTVNETFKILIPRKKHNEIKNGYIALLHTWTQEVKFNAHLHCLVPEGQYNITKNKWESTSNKILNKEILNITFKKLLTQNLISWIKENKDLNINITEEYLLGKSKNSKSYVYVNKSLKNVTGVIQYLGKYSNKIAISNKRIISYDGENVELSYIDRADGNKIKSKKINAIVFLKRYADHILPKKFSKIRYYGFFANSCKSKYIKICKSLLKKEGCKLSELDNKIIKRIIDLFEIITRPIICPVCHIGELALVT